MSYTSQLSEKIKQLREKYEKGQLTPEEYVELIELEREYERAKKLAEISRSAREFKKLCEEIGGTYVKEVHSWKCILKTPRKVTVISTNDKIVLDVDGKKIEVVHLQASRRGEVTTVHIPEKNVSVTFIKDVTQIVRFRTDEPKHHIQLI